MNSYFSTYKELFLLAVSILLFDSCDKVTDDVLPLSYQDFQLYPDDIYLFNGNTGSLVRLDPLGNDSLKSSAKVTFTQPLHGKLSIQPDGDTYYTPDMNFIGTDSLMYTVCSPGTCKSEKIRLFVEKPFDPNHCTNSLGADSLETTRNTPASIRIFMNDIICSAFVGRSIYKPEKGTFKLVEYSGSYKNTIYMYYPPKGFVGEDSFKYRIHPDPNNHDKVYLEMVVKVKVK
jgi:hypothetical protein